MMENQDEFNAWYDNEVYSGRDPGRCSGMCYIIQNFQPYQEKVLKDMLKSSNLITTIEPADNHSIISGWINITPETMPPENKQVILTTKNPDGSKTTDVAKWCGEKLGWMILFPGFHPSTLADEAVRFEITHWMPYPEPAED